MTTTSPDHGRAAGLDGRTVVAGLVMGAGLVYVLGFTPWGISVPSSWYNVIGPIRCGALSLRDVLGATCGLVGGPQGADVGNGWPIVVAGSFLVRMSPLSAEWAFTALATVMMTTGVVGSIRLAERFGIGRPYSFLTAVFYLLSPTLVGMTPFGSTFWGMALLPAAVWLQLAAADLMTRRLVLIAPILPLWALGAFTLLGIDGYAFVMAQATVGLLLVVEPRGARMRRWLVALPTYLVANVVAYVGYRVLSPADIDAKSSIDLFRAMGLDVITLVRPSVYQWWAPHSIAVDPTMLWGDGSNSRFNYVGLVALALAIVGAVAALRRRSSVAWWLVVAGISLFLAFGPSLKIDEVRGPLEMPVTYQSYLMPGSDAAATLPTQWLYEEAPGLSTMRATYRWFTLTRLAEAMLVAAGAYAIARRGRRWQGATLALVGIAALELSPGVPHLLGTAHEHAAEVRNVDRTVVRPLDAALPDWSRVLISPNNDGANDYMASYIASGARLRMYNVGGDKAVATAVPRWPADVRNLLTARTDYAKSIRRVLRLHQVDAVIVPRFDLRWDADSWPPSPASIERGDKAVAELQGDRALRVQDLGRVAVVTLAPKAAAS